MMSGIRSHTLSLLTALAFGCGGGDASSAGPGTTSAATAQVEINLTDAPGSFSEVVVTIDGIEIETTKSNGLVPLTLNIDVPVRGPVIFINRAEGSVTIDLNRLTGGRTMKLASGEVPDGHIRKIRLHVIESDVNGTPTPWVREAVAGAPRMQVKMAGIIKNGIDIIPRNVRVEGGSLSEMTIDFNASKSIVLHTIKGANGRNDTAEYHLRPVIFLLESESMATPPTTIATGMNYPRGTAYMRGDENTLSDDRIVVINTGENGVQAESNAGTVLRFNPNDFLGTAPFNASDPAQPVDRQAMGKELRDVSGIEELSGWQSVDVLQKNSIVSLDPVDITISSRIDLPVEHIYALTQAPGVIDDGPAWVIAYHVDTVDANGKKKTKRPVAYLDPALGPNPIVLIEDIEFHASDIVFVPNYPAGRFGTVYVSMPGSKRDDPTDDRLFVATLVFDGNTVSVEGAPRVFKDLDSWSEPIGMALNADGDGIWIAQRGNGFIHLVDLDLNPLNILNTGLGPNSLNGIEVLRNPALAGFRAEPEVLMITNTLGEDDRRNDDPLDEDQHAISSIDVLVPR